MGIGRNGLLSALLAAILTATAYGGVPQQAGQVQVRVTIPERFELQRGTDGSLCLTTDSGAAHRLVAEESGERLPTCEDGRPHPSTIATDSSARVLVTPI